MKFNLLSTTLALVATLFPIALSGPLDAHATDGVWVCSKPDWAGECNWTKASNSDTLCFGLPEHSQSVSFGPDPDVTCTVFTNENCNTDIGVPGTMTKDYGFPGSAQIPGPAYQGGAGTAFSPAYRAYRCKPIKSKRNIGTSENNFQVEDATLPTLQGPVKRERDSDTESHEDMETKPTNNEASQVDANTLTARENRGVYTCQFPNYQGICTWLSVTNKDDLGKCMPLPYISQTYISFGPDEGVACRVYTSPICVQGEGLNSLGITHPGASNMFKAANEQGGGFRRFQCWLM